MANKIYRVLETSLTFKDSGGSAVITLQNLANGVGRVSAQYDRGAGSLAQDFFVIAVMEYASAPQLTEVVEIYTFEGDGTYVAGTLGTSDAALTSAKKVNGNLVNLNIVDTTSTNTDVVSMGRCTITMRYFSVGVWNGSSGDNLRNTANTSSVIFIPVPPEIQ